MLKYTFFFDCDIIHHFLNHCTTTNVSDGDAKFDCQPIHQIKPNSLILLPHWLYYSGWLLFSHENHFNMHSCRVVEWMHFSYVRRVVLPHTQKPYSRRWHFGPNFNRMWTSLQWVTDSRQQDSGATHQLFNWAFSQETLVYLQGMYLCIFDADMSNDYLLTATVQQWLNVGWPIHKCCARQVRHYLMG